MALVYSDDLHMLLHAGHQKGVGGVVFVGHFVMSDEDTLREDELISEEEQRGILTCTLVSLSS